MEAKIQPKLQLNVDSKPSVTPLECCKHPTQVKQLVRAIGAADTPESQSVESVNARLSQLLQEGWTIHTAQALATGPGGAVTVYYLLTK